jgi:hypothetical protein
MDVAAQLKCCCMPCVAAAEILLYAMSLTGVHVQCHSVYTL